ncbi:MAG: hypothetical protein E7371_05985 [Clostridiales bacterium]|nr:hypothetical protein [Clostridiales bacterium]
MEEKKQETEDLFEDVLVPEGWENPPEKQLNADMPPSNPKKYNLKIVLMSIAIAVVFFILGGFSVWLSIDKGLWTLAKIKNTIDKHYYKEIDDEDFYKALIDAVNYDLLDAYSQYMTADEYTQDRNDMAGKRIGIGGVFSTVNEKREPQMLVTRVCGNSPAETAGLHAGDYVTAFGKTETDLTESEVFNDFSAFLQTCKENEEFFVRVRRGAENKILKMSRQAYVENYLFYRTSTTAYSFGGKKAKDLQAQGEPLACLDADTAYIRLTQFAGDVDERFDDLMEIFKEEGKKHLVLDLRSNGGGYLDIMQGIAKYFCKDTTENRPLAVIADYGEVKKGFTAKGNLYNDYFTEDSRICVLADDGTASASECLIGFMVDYGAVDFSDICLIERNGEAKTYGKGIMQTTFLVGVTGDAIRLTTAEIRWPVSQRSIHDRGILPEDGAKFVPAGHYGDGEIGSALTALKE